MAVTFCQYWLRVWGINTFWQTNSSLECFTTNIWFRKLEIFLFFRNFNYLLFYLLSNFHKVFVAYPGFTLNQHSKVDQCNTNGWWEGRRATDATDRLLQIREFLAICDKPQNTYLRNIALGWNVSSFQRN